MLTVRRRSVMRSRKNVIFNGGDETKRAVWVRSLTILLFGVIPLFYISTDEAP